MIIFYQKSTGNIVGTVDGRVHDKDTIKGAWIQPSNIPKKDIGKYVVPFEPNFVVEEIPIKELRVVNKKTMRVVEVIVGKKKQKVIRGLKPAVPFANLIYAFESGKEKILNYKVKLENEKVIGFEKKVKN